MSAQKPSIPKGTRDFTPPEMVRRNHIFGTIRRVFESFGYLPIETPAMENLSTLMGKYGEEGDKLLFKILNSGDYLDPLRQEGNGFPELNSFTRRISEKGLRYDLTVPFARFVVQHQNELAFPFKRYQIQPVWRADRPQKGRYREFFQCDVDVIGSPSLIYEAEMIQIIDDVFSLLGIEVVTLVNNRKILAGIAETIGAAEKMTELTVAIDKLDKTGIGNVIAELRERGFSGKSVELLTPLLSLEAGHEGKTGILRKMMASSETGMKGLEELERLSDMLNSIRPGNRWEFDLRLARGLNYYTGTIIEVKAAGVAMGSICGGGRYDDLTGIFGLPGMSGVGISFGADRIYDVLSELNAFPKELGNTTKVLFANFGTEESVFSLGLLQELRRSGIAGEIYPDSSKLKKQIEYASRKQIPFMVMIGRDEMQSGLFTLKDLSRGEQYKVTREELIGRLG